MAERPGLIRLALFGSPVSQSLSPRIHHLFAEQAGLDIEYPAIETGAGHLAAGLRQLEDHDGAGCNVTLPLKAEARALASQCTEAVRLAGAANTLVRRPDGGWDAHSTDGPGLLADLAAADIALPGIQIALLGAGGAAASVLGSLLSAKPARLSIFNRSLEKAEVLAREHAHLGQVSAHAADAWANAGPYSLVINATSLGHQGLVPLLDCKSLATGSLVYDMNYGSASQPLQAWCEENGVAYRDGLGMLVEQAAASFRLWTGFKADTQAVLANLRT